MKDIFFTIKVPVNQNDIVFILAVYGFLQTVGFNPACSWFVLQIYGIRKPWGTSCTTTTYNRSRLGPSTSPTTLSPWMVRIPLQRVEPPRPLPHSWSTSPPTSSPWTVSRSHQSVQLSPNSWSTSPPTPSPWTVSRHIQRTSFHPQLVNLTPNPITMNGK